MDAHTAKIKIDNYNFSLQIIKSIGKTLRERTILWVSARAAVV